MASGSLGQGLSVACGAAQAKKLNGEDRWVYSLHGDGELREGQIWEAAMYAAHHKLDNLISFVDYNGQQIDGAVEDVMSLGDLAAKWAAFGWTVLECNGHDLGDLDRIFKEARAAAGQGGPVVVLMRTDMGRGRGLHGRHPQVARRRAQRRAVGHRTGQLASPLADY